nr:uncharacterized protein DDB_G0290685-like [Nicotiana tomentosiformis]
MPRASQTPSKTKSSTKAKEKTKIIKPKSKKNTKPSREPTPTPTPYPSISSTIPTLSSHFPTIHDAHIILTSTVSPPPKTTTHAPELPATITSKFTNVKATPRKSVKKVPDAATQGNIIAKESVVQGELVLVTTNQVQHPPSKLDVLLSSIDATSLDTLLPTSEKPPVKEFTVETGAGDMGKEVDTTAVEPVVEGWTEDEEDDGGEKEEEVVNSHEEHDTQNISNEEKKSENKGAYGDEKESDIEDNTGEHANDSTKEENHSEEEEVYETRSEETSEENRAQEPESLLTPFTGDEEVSSDKDDVPLSKESRSAKKPKKKVSIVESVVEVDGEDESDTALPAKSATPKKKGAKFVNYCILQRSERRHKATLLDMVVMELLDTGRPINIPSLMIQHMARAADTSKPQACYALWFHVD